MSTQAISPTCAGIRGTSNSGTTWVLMTEVCPQVCSATTPSTGRRVRPASAVFVSEGSPSFTRYPSVMAKVKTERTVKEPGRLRQMWQVFQVTRERDKHLTLLLVVSLVLPILAGVALAFLLPGGGVLSWILWSVTGLLAGVLISLIVLGRRAERAAYQQISGQHGAVGAVIQNALRRSWRGSEVPVAINPRTQDAVYRVVGRGGVVLITEGPSGRTKKMRLDEERKLKRALPNVTITHISVGPDADAVPLERLSRTLVKLPKALNRHEVQAVYNRLLALQQTAGPVGIPKGIDPMKVRPGRPR